jgi:hypothetical protein
MIATALDGQPVGSIRRVTVGRTCGGGAEPALPELTAIEIEVKTGRHVHLVAARGVSGIRLRAGALPATAGASRSRQDLTAALPGAFDGRPRVAAVVPVEPLGAENADPIARAWRIELSTGVRLWCHRTGDAVEIVQEQAP